MSTHIKMSRFWCFQTRYWESAGAGHKSDWISDSSSLENIATCSSPGRN